ncbi:hypothetical protein C5Y96_00875 [Blastopirellula marina]|uniref:Uncharacterized protein n=1 Tax=Blastopirellula marina TaxID=124 RepID=A0A2S8GA07_9BACT|nr:MULTISPECIES: hypothetical protein [Pirellulaceae]PQO41296.1 hypothetical protein C5Y96_00875 [Blastopirellula marina]RCS56320.1 hypothetical protein DTL36_00875 [Bremerella cremea]
MAFLWQFVILADQPPAGFSAMGEHFRAENAHFNLPHFIILALVVLVIASLVWTLSRWQESEAAWNVDNPQRLFGELCKKHELSSKDASLLKKIGRELQLTHPASMFCDPSLLVSAMKLEKFHDLHSQLAKLGEEFFGYHLWKQAIAADNSVHQEASIG